MNEFIKVKTLLGHKGLSFSIKCLQSFVQNAGTELWITIYEDGTLTKEDKQQLAVALPDSNIVDKIECETIVLEKLAGFPACLQLRKTVLYARKIFDLLLYDGQDALYIDSDVFFVKKFDLPVFTDSPVFMQDTQNAYTFKPAEFIQIPFPIYRSINSGFFFFPYQYFDVSYIEQLLNNKIIKRGYSRNVAWLEQTIWAFLASRNKILHYFSNMQVAMATESTQITDQTICIHLVSSHRDQFVNLKLDAPKIKSTDTVHLIKLVPAKQLLKVPHFYRERVMKRLKRYLK